MGPLKMINFDRFYHDNIIIGPSTAVDLDAVYLSDKNNFLNLSLGGTNLTYTYFFVKKSEKAKGTAKVKSAALKNKPKEKKEKKKK